MHFSIPTAYTSRLRSCFIIAARTMQLAQTTISLGRFSEILGEYRSPEVDNFLTGTLAF
jgi:hypothetical protein